jgi:hypothetical protein
MAEGRIPPGSQASLGGEPWVPVEQALAAIGPVVAAPTALPPTPAPEMPPMFAAAEVNQPAEPGRRSTGGLAVGLVIGGALLVFLLGTLAAVVVWKIHRPKPHRTHTTAAVEPKQETPAASHSTPSPWLSTDPTAGTPTRTQPAIEEQPSFEPGKPFYISDVQFPLPGRREVKGQDTNDCGTLRVWWQTGQSLERPSVYVKIYVPGDPAYPTTLTYVPTMPTVQGEVVSFRLITGTKTIGLKPPHGRVQVEVALSGDESKDSDGHTHYEIISNLVSMTANFE